MSLQDKYDERDAIVAFIRERAKDYGTATHAHALVFALELDCLAALVFQGRYPPPKAAATEAPKGCEGAEFQLPKREAEALTTELASMAEDLAHVGQENEVAEWVCRRLVNLVAKVRTPPPCTHPQGYEDWHHGTWHCTVCGEGYSPTRGR